MSYLMYDTKIKLWSHIYHELKKKTFYIHKGSMKQNECLRLLKNFIVANLLCFLFYILKYLSMPNQDT